MPSDKTDFDQARKGLRRKFRDRLNYKYRTKEVKCTLTIQEHTRVVQSARSTGMKPATYLKRTAFAYMGREYVVPVNIEKAMLNLIYEISAIGNNLNQIARKANLFQKVTTFDLREAKRLTNELEKAVTTFITRPPRK